MDFLRVCGNCFVSHAPNGTRFAEAISLLGLPVGSRTIRGGRAGFDYKYLDPAPRPLIHRLAFDTGWLALLSNVGAPRETQRRRSRPVVFACGTCDLKRPCGFISDHHVRMKDFCQCLNTG